MKRAAHGGAPYPALLMIVALSAGCRTVVTHLRSELRLDAPVGALPSAPPRPKDIPTIRATFMHELVARRKVDGVKLRVYKCGAVTVAGSSVSALKSASAKLELDAPCYVVRHPEQGLLLFDAGVSPGRAGKGRFGALPDSAAQEGRDAVSALRADGVEPAEIKRVVVSSLRFDHAGMVDAFPEAEVLVDRRELEHARAEEASSVGYDAGVSSAAARARLAIVDLSTAPAYGPFDHARDLFGDGTAMLVDLSGYAPGGLGLWLNLDEGPVLLAGDAVWVLDNYQDLAPPAKALIHDAALYWRRVYQLRDAEAALPRLMILPGHDLMPLRLKPRADITLAQQ